MRLVTVVALVAITSALSAQSLRPVRLFTEQTRAGDVEYEVDYSEASYKLRVVPDEELEELALDWPDLLAPLQKLHASYREAAEAAAAAGLDFLPSVQCIGGKTKQLDDGIYAGVETVLELGVEATGMGKQEFLERLLASLLEGHETAVGGDAYTAGTAVAYVATAVRLGGGKDNVPHDVDGMVIGNVESFLADEARSKPIGFYTWSDDLKRIFTRDRWCQTELNFAEEWRAGAAVLIARAIAADPELARAHAAIQGVYERLSNPYSTYTMEDVAEAAGPAGLGADLAPAIASVREELHPQGTVALFPASGSKETDLFNRVSPWAAEDADLMELLIEKVESGAVSLEPTADSGWYEYQQFALEPLLLPDRMPEAAKLELDEEYRKRLRQAFAAMLTKARETHVKQLDDADGADAPLPMTVEVDVYPPFGCEPLASVYGRQADGYVFLGGVVADSLGDVATTAPALAEGAEPREGSIAETVDEAFSLSLGCYLATCRDLGIPPSAVEELGVSEADALAALEAADQWLADAVSDADLARDTRVAVPVFLLPDGRVKCWATVGVKLTMIEAVFDEPPTVRVISAPAGVEMQPNFRRRRMVVPDDAFIEFSAAAPLDRDELRRICDESGSPEEIAKALAQREQEEGANAKTGRAAGLFGMGADGRGSSGLEWLAAGVAAAIVLLTLALILRRRGAS